MLNVWSVALIHAAFLRYMVERPLLIAVILTIVATIFVPQRSAVALAAWLASWAAQYYTSSYLELSVAQWLILGAITAAIAYAIWRATKDRKLPRAVLVIAPIVLAAALLALEWPRGEEYDLSTLGVFLGAWQEAIVPLIVLALLWRATFSQRRAISIPAALLVAMLAARTWDLWQGFLYALA